MKITFARAGTTTLAALGLAFVGASAHAQTTIVAGWNFDNLSSSNIGTAQAPASIAADLGTNQAGATLSAGGTKAFASIEPDNTTPSYAYIAGGDNTPGTSIASAYALRLGIGQSTATTSANNGSTLVFNASTVGYSNILVSYNTYASSTTAFQTQQLGYSVNGTTFTLVGPTYAVPAQSVTGSDAAGYSTNTVNLSSITALNNDANAKYEIVFSGAPGYTSNKAPNDRFDNLSVNGTILAGTPSAAPEPSQAAGLGFFLLGVSSLALRARKKAAAAV